MDNWIKELSFAQRQRLQFIETLLIWDDAVQRKDVCDVFNVTPNHLTRDIKRYRTHNKGALEYDIEARTYRKGAKFKPLLASGSSSEYLALLQAFSSSHAHAIIPAIGYIVSAETIPTLTGETDTIVLKSVIQSVKNRTGLSILYQSLSDTKPTKRTIWPHTLVFTGERWHARAYDNHSSDFRDFVLTRIIKTETLITATKNQPQDDKLWNEYQLIQVMPAPHLSSSQKSVIAKEYGMTLDQAASPSWSANIRKCMVGYFLARNRLEFGGNIDGIKKNGQHPYLALCDPTLANTYRFNSEHPSS